jgi:Amt family ammonium transporter
VLAYSLVVTLVLGFIIDKTIGFRVDEEVEVNGIDLDQHLETAYDLAASGGGALGSRASIGSATQAGVNA